MHQEQVGWLVEV